mmetsp:Transcript_10723/g.46437  ORF Transcript_10723/g.46437 Transcript_10723/m.46437 type:complete len:603 (+) Transcript_10723:1000-2808(+)
MDRANPPRVDWRSRRRSTPRLRRMKGIAMKMTTEATEKRCSTATRRRGKLASLITKTTLDASLTRFLLLRHLAGPAHYRDRDPVSQGAPAATRLPAQPKLGYVVHPQRVRPTVVLKLPRHLLELGLVVTHHRERLGRVLVHVVRVLNLRQVRLRGQVLHHVLRARRGGGRDVVEPHVHQKRHPRTLTLAVTSLDRLTFVPFVPFVPFFLAVLAFFVATLRELAGRAVQPPTVKRRVLPSLRPRQVRARRPAPQVRHLVRANPAPRSERPGHRLAVAHWRRRADEQSWRALVCKVGDGSHVRMHVEVVVFQGVVLVPVQSDGVVRRIDDLRPPLRARSRRVERGRSVRVALALILPAPRRVRDVQVEYLLREVLQRAPRLVLGGDPERLPGAVLLLGAAAGLLLDAPGGENPPAVGEDARVQLRILVQPLDEVGESPERVELEVVDRGSVHSTVLSHHQVQLFLLFGVAVGVVVLVVLVIVLIGSRLVVLVLVLLQVVLLVAATVLLEHSQPRLELVRPGDGALHAAHHHRGGVDQQINLPRELARVERASGRRVPRVDDVRGDGFILPLLFGVERLEVPTLGPVVLAGVYVSDDEGFAAPAA